MQESAPFEKVTSFQAAARQLRLAIRMFFERKDMIAVHTLAAAAEEVLIGLGKPKGLKSIFDESLDLIVPEKRTEFSKTIRAAQNDFKHADRDPDPDAEILFYFDATKYHLFNAARLLVSMTGRHTRETATLTGFFLATHPNIFRLDSMPELKQIGGKFAEAMKDFDLVLRAMDEMDMPDE